MIRAWLLDHWRLKVLAVVLALVLFGAVAFAQNPVTVRTMTVPINSYLNENPDLVILNYPKTVDVQLVGLANVVNPVKPDDIRTVMDLTRVQPPAEGATRTEIVKVYVNAQVAAQGVTLQQSSIPLYVTVDRISTVQLPLQIDSPTASGVTIDKTVVLDHATQQPVAGVTVTGPQTVLAGLTAFVDLGAVQGSLFSSAAPVQFKDRAGRIVKWPLPTIPPPTLDVGTVDVSITAHQNFQQKVVSLLEYPSGQPACGYEISGITITPNPTVTLTGTETDLAKVSSLTLNPVDVTNATGNVTSRQPVIVPPSATSLQVTPSTVTVTIGIKQAATCAPASPQPTPSSSPTP